MATQKVQPPSITDIIFPWLKGATIAGQGVQGYTNAVIQSPLVQGALGGAKGVFSSPAKTLSTAITGSTSAPTAQETAANKAISTVYKPTPPSTKVPPTTDQKSGAGGAGKKGGGGGGGGGSDLSNLIAQLATPSDAYQKAQEAQAAMLPLIQQRYKALLDEITQSEQTQTTAQEKAQTTQLGETKARAGAAGTFASSTELGTEDIIRKATADAEAVIQQTGDIQKAKAVAQQGIDEAQVVNQIAQLGISQAQAEKSGLKDALTAIIEEQKVQTTGVNALLTPGEASTLGVPYGTTRAQASGMGIVPKKQLTPTGIQQQANVTSALDQINNINGLIYDAQGNIRTDVLGKALLPGGAFDSDAQQFQAASNELVDVLARLRTGAVINQQEMKEYQAKVPKPWDAPETVNAKMKQLSNFFNTVQDRINSQYGDNTSGTLDTLFSQYVSQ